MRQWSWRCSGWFPALAEPTGSGRWQGGGTLRSLARRRSPDRTDGSPVLDQPGGELRRVVGGAEEPHRQAAGGRGDAVAPVLGGLTEQPLFWSATLLTAFNDNALITYLSTLVPNLSDTLKYAVVAGAVTGGGLTVIANAPNPAGQAILGKYFQNGVSPMWLAASAAGPTLVAAACFLLL